MDTLLSFVREDLLPFLTEIGNTIRGVPNEVRKMESELQRIQAFIHRADRLVAAEKEKDKQDEIKKKVKLLAEAAFLIEDVIDDYKIYKELQSRHRGCAALPCRVAAYLIRRHQIAHNIQSIKSQVSEIKESSNRDNDFFVQFSLEQGGSSSTGNQEVTWLSLREAPLYMNEADIVGFGAPKDELIGWLVKGRAELTVISVVGMGGRGKTTLAKKVFDNHEVIGHFECRVWVTVSQTYTVEGLLRDLLKALHKGSPPQNLPTMDRRSLIEEVRNYLNQKRYFILFDDVWNVNFWDQISFALIDKKNQSRILITTRNMPVAECCMKSSFVEIHELQPFSEAESWELFCKKAFQFESDGCCPQELQHISSEIVKKCQGLPLAIVAIGGLLSSKQKIRFQWEEFHRNLSLELDKNPDLADITKILGFSYNDLPYHLKSCFLHFGIYPEDYEIEVKELIHQWVAEGFVKDKPSEEVAEQYLRELIGRSLVQVSSLTIDGKAKRCRVHDMLREMILRKFEDLSFCHAISSEDNEPGLGGIIRRLSIATDSNDFLERSIERPHLRSLYAFTDKSLPEDFVMNIPNKYRLLKVLHFRMRSDVLNVPENLGNLIHLKYLSFRGASIISLPESIGNLENLETLDLMHTGLGGNVPKEITKLRKLRHFYVDSISMSWIKGEDGIGGIVSLQTLKTTVIISSDEQVRELEKLHQLRTLMVRFVSSKDRSVSFSIEQMKHLETLVIDACNVSSLQLNCISPPRKLQELHLFGRLYKLPEWFLKLQNLVVLTLHWSKLSEDPLPSLKNMSSLLALTLEDHDYIGETMHFQDGWFQKLKRLELIHFSNLNSIIIDGGALHSLQSLHLRSIPQLKTVPAGIQHLQNLRVLECESMSHEFKERISANGGQDRWIVDHVPLVLE